MGFLQPKLLADFNLVLIWFINGFVCTERTLKKLLRGGGSREFENLDAEARIAELERKVGSLTMENVFLKKVLRRLESNGGAKIPMDGER